MKAEVQALLSPIIGQECCRANVGHGNSLVVGFGRKIFHNNPNLHIPYHGEWELRTFYCAWRVMDNRDIVVGKNDMYEVNEMDGRIACLLSSHVTVIEEHGDLDITMMFDTGAILDIFATTSDDSDYFYFSLPGSRALVRSRGGTWTLMDSDKPLVEANARVLQ